MNCFLVLLRHTMDDLPVAVYDNKKDALFEAKRIAGDNLNGMPTEAIRKVYSTDCSTPCVVCVVEFREGKPIRLMGSVAFIGA